MTRLDERAFPQLLPFPGAIDMPGPLLTDALWGRNRPPAALKARFHSTSMAAYLEFGRPTKPPLILSE
jgi:hypothetical protein